jgi:hypothetical protein
MDGISVQAGLVEIETDVALGIDDSFYQTVLCTFNFLDQRSNGGSLICNIQHSDTSSLSDGTTTNPATLAWDVANELLYMGFNLKA